MTDQIATFIIFYQLSYSSSIYANILTSKNRMKNATKRDQGQRLKASQWYGIRFKV